MPLTLIEVKNLRVLEFVSLRPSHGLNIVCGPNGGGKTSLLEAVHFLGVGRSFCSNNAVHAVRRGAEQLTVHGRLATRDGKEIALGIERNKAVRRIKVNGRTCDSIAKLAQALPLQVIVPDTRYLFLHNSRFRRGVLDWGLFHVEPRFHGLWRRCQRALRQRNAALRAGMGAEALVGWEHELALAGEQLHELRQRYQRPWNERIAHYARRLLGGTTVHVELQRGWPLAGRLAQVLAEQRADDEANGYTRAGIHRADLKVYVDGLPLKDWTSHGQQKLAITTLLLAQIDLFMRAGGAQCLLLLDDFAGELDENSRSRLLAVLATLGVQTFASAGTTAACSTWNKAIYAPPRRSDGRVRCRTTYESARVCARQ